MKRLLLVAFVFAGIGCAQSSNGSSGHPEAAKPGDTPRQDGLLIVCKLETVTWNPETEELSWVVSMRSLNGGTDAPATQEKYTVHIDTAIMNSSGEGRRFDASEAKQVGELMDLISTYAVESTVWWTKGMGEKVDGTETPSTQTPSPQTKERDKKNVDPAPAPPRIRAANLPDSQAVRYRAASASGR
jgi:hypothetical protein